MRAMRGPEFSVLPFTQHRGVRTTPIWSGLDQCLSLYRSNVLLMSKNDVSAFRKECPVSEKAMSRLLDNNHGLSLSKNHALGLSKHYVLSLNRNSVLLLNKNTELLPDKSNVLFLTSSFWIDTMFCSEEQQGTLRD